MPKLKVLKQDRHNTLYIPIHISSLLYIFLPNRLFCIDLHVQYIMAILFMYFFALSPIHPFFSIFVFIICIITMLQSYL